MTQITMYGIKNCDTVKKARHFLDSHHIEYTFHDFKKQGLSRELLENWEKAIGFETLLNKRSTTWRKLDEKDKQNIDKHIAMDLMLQNPSLIKRPVLSANNKILVGFTEDVYQTLDTNA